MDSILPTKTEGWLILIKEEMNDYLLKARSRNNYDCPQENRLDSNKNSAFIGDEDSYNEQRSYNDNSNFFEIETVALPQITQFVDFAYAVQKQGIISFDSLLRFKKYVDKWPKGDKKYLLYGKTCQKKSNNTRQ